MDEKVELLTQEPVAKMLGVSPRTIEAWRVRGGGPPFVRLGRAIRYRLSDVLKFVEENVARSTSEPRGAAGSPKATAAP